jgi:small-conductance mechanosensitive channel
MQKNHLLLIVGLFTICSVAICGEIMPENEEKSTKSRAEEDLSARVSSLERQLVGAKNIMLESGRGKDIGYLEELERKARAYESASLAIADRDKSIDELKKELAAIEKTKTVLEEQVRQLSSATNSMAARISAMEDERNPFKEALKLIRKGKFEYYQIKPGDTCESIAAQPTMYNDASKHVLIRQANRGGVADLDNLVPDEILVIPRFQLGSNYEF